jgi:hypothetical protein
MEMTMATRFGKRRASIYNEVEVGALANKFLDEWKMAIVAGL